MALVLRKVSHGHPDNGVHVAWVESQRPSPPIVTAECGKTITRALWLRKSPVTCNDCKVAVVTRHKERASAPRPTGTAA